MNVVPDVGAVVRSTASTTISRAVDPIGRAIATIAAGDDDARQRHSAGATGLTDTIASLTSDMYLGFISRGMDIPQGASMQSAVIEFASGKISGSRDPLSAPISAFAQGGVVPPFVSGTANKNISLRPLVPGQRERGVPVALAD